MKISTRVEYGIIALLDIAINSENGKAVSIAGISERQNISAKYLEQLLTALKQAHLIRGQKGSRGGYILARSSSDISFDEIINALDITILSDSQFDGSTDISLFKSTINNCLWNKMNSFLRNFAKKITLAEVSEQCKLANGDGSEYMYYI